MWWESNNSVEISDIESIYLIKDKLWIISGLTEKHINRLTP